ncbi:MAG: TfoX/Sxy family protein [Candidatus Nanopelagicales bacterium]
MAYDEELASRIRDCLEGGPGVTESTMFGGLAFLVNGNMAIAASHQGGALVRVDPAESDELVDTTTAEIAVMRGRPMPGWLRVPADDLETADQVRVWADRSAAYAGSLPPKDGG